jgi:RNase P/RNase MRP subunit p29
MDNGLETPKFRPPDYQQFDDIQFTEDESDPEALEVVVSPDLPDDELPGQVKASLENQLKNNCWWLRDSSREKGVPKEQVTIEISSEDGSVGKVEVYNFGESLTEQHTEQLQGVFATVAKIDGGEILNKVKYVIIEKDDVPNELTGEPTSGASENEPSCGVIQIYPHGLRQTEHRTGLPSHFEATVAHELGHVFLRDGFLEDWQDEFGWTSINEPTTSTGGREITMQTDQACVSEYASFEPGEDMPDSFAVYALDSEKLREVHPGKLSFLEQRLPIKNNETSTKAIKRQGSDVQLPEIQNPQKYKVTRKKTLFRMRMKT